jgi:hypothetical protein
LALQELWIVDFTAKAKPGMETDYPNDINNEAGDAILIPA